MPAPFLRHNEQREAEIHNRLIDALASRFRRKLAQEIADQSREMLDALEADGVIPPQPDQYERAFRDIYMDLAEASVRTMGYRIVSRTKSGAADLETKADGWAEIFRGIALAFINSEPIRRRIVSVAETTRQRIVDAVSRGQRDGLGIDEIAKGIRKDLPSMSRLRAATIARTETHGAANYGSQEVAKRTGIDLVKKWISVEDARTRDFGAGDGEVDEFDHRSMNDQIREMDEPFDMPWVRGGTVKAMFAGDPSLPAGACINCRCATVHLPRWALDE